MLIFIKSSCYKMVDVISQVSKWKYLGSILQLQNDKEINEDHSRYKLSG